MIFLSDHETQQGSTSWHDWRKQGIGGSDVAAVLGISPWSTPYQLYLEKTGRKKAFQGNYATARGQELEPRARAAYEIQEGSDFEPCLLVHPEHSFMRVSLDGYNKELSRVLEIKCPGAEDHALAVAGKVPEKYLCQLQYQLYVSGAKEAHYFSYDGESGVTVTVLPDLEMQGKIAEAVTIFWNGHVLADRPPKLTEKDALEVQDEQGLFCLYLQLHKTMKDAEARLEKVRAEIIEEYTELHPKIRCGAITVSKVERKGQVDYGKAIDGIFGADPSSIDFEAYRKPSSFTYQVKVNEQ